MNHNFTDQARTVLGYAREESIRLGHDYVGTEHLLLGLIRDRRGPAAAVLIGLSADMDAIWEYLERAVPRGRSRVTMGELPFTSRAKKALEYTLGEARELNHGHTGAEHLLLGLLREEKGIAAEVLNRVGVTLDRARRQLLSQPPAPSEAVESIRRPTLGYDEVIAVHLTNGEVHRVLEKHGPNAREFVEVIARRGVWITGQETFFVPVTAIARIQVYSPEDWERRGGRAPEPEPTPLPSSR